jgi:IS30 family transposase
MKRDLKTITADNGKEFSLHTQIAKGLEIDFYFQILTVHGKEVQIKIQMV